ncbi:hypothetical protein B0T14DRAFT_599058 [Immersiella caudata]|uniref:Uncharacterized protein n=1 Tax=Immersiella caudata TaxID=314043 RepID=A0AA39XHN9_9PEZI|nr:hypothetical protein B0T14DRAFT_599058 [Immersiella caudata]
MDAQHANQPRNWDSPHQPQDYAVPAVGGYGHAPGYSDEPKTTSQVEQHAAPQEPSPPTPIPPRRKTPFWSWSWEMLSLFLAIGLIAAIFAILSSYNGQRVPDWGLSINLSTLVALLATILRASLVMIAAEVISQAKWSWFTRSGEQLHPLSQLQTFDAASRGAFGAAHLIPTVLLRSPLALVAAIITIVSFTTGPFVQQAIKTVSCNEIVLTSRASVPIAHYAPGTSGYYTMGPGQHELTSDMKAALIAGLSNPTAVSTNIVASCSTGNCTFADYASIGLCSYCQDVTPLVTGPHQLNGTRFGEFRLPTDPAGAGINLDNNGAYLAVSAADNMTWVGDFPSQYAWAVLNFTVFSAKDGPSSTSKRCKDDNSTCAYTASACAIYPCMRMYSATVSSGVLAEAPVSSVPAFPDLTFQNLSGTLPPVYPPLMPRAMELTAIQTPCHLEDETTYTSTNITSAPDAIPLTYTTPGTNARIETSAPIQCIHRMYDYYAFALGRYLGGMLEGTCRYGGKQAGTMDCTQPATEYFTDAFWLDVFFHNWTATPETIAATVETLALAGTNRIRLTGKTASVDNDADMASGTTGDAVEGEVWATGVCTEVDWRWLLLPAILVGLTVVVLIATIVGSWKRPVWKASVLPVVFYGRRFVTRDGETVGADEHGEMSLEEMEKVAGKVEVRLEVAAGEGGWAETLKGTRRVDADVDSLLLRDVQPGTAR